MNEQKYDEADSSASDNPPSMGEVEENTTFYYSNFKLFNEHNEMLFTKYILFKHNLKAFLGEDWNNYARLTIYKKVEDTKVYSQGDTIFNTALEIWLELRRDINFDIGSKKSDTKETSEGSMNDISTEEQATNVDDKKEKEDTVKEKEKEDATDALNEIDSETADTKFEDNIVFETFDEKLREKFKNHEIDDASYNAVIRAFHISARKVWRETLSSSLFNPLGGNRNEGFVMESKKYILNKLQNLYKTKSKMLKPILVATEKITDYIFESQKHVHSDTSSVISVQDEKELKNIQNFNSNFQMESPEFESSGGDEDLKTKLNNLSITENKGERVKKNSKRRNPYSKNTVIEIKKVNKKTEKMLNQNIIEFALHYINTIVKTTNKDWQITRNFVTNMVEVNYNRLAQLESKISNKASDIKNEIKIRFIQPAQEFYNQLMEIWIIFKTNSCNKEILFTEYLDKVKHSLGNHWSDRYVTPTQNFFMTLYYEWNHLKQVESENEEKLLLFVKKVKENMLKTWEENIVKKAEELTNKKINIS